MSKLTHKLLKRFSVRNLILISAMAALGLAVKPLIVPLVHLISTPLMIPGGALAGGFYMMWLVMAAALTRQRGSATLTGLVQAIFVLVTGAPGSHGALSLVTYTVPGLIIDLFLLLIRRQIDCRFIAFIACLLANLAGTALTNMIFFRLPAIPLMLSLVTSAFSGGLGGLLTWEILKALSQYGIEVHNHDQAE
ncbi:MAG TPA: hypothetical protein DCM45_03930 [Clostridiales bacterium]|nr:hypothetical protein [Clostridiales bacterium]